MNPLDEFMDFQSLEEYIRSRIAHDLHDGIGILISTTKMRLTTNYEQSLQTETQNLLADVVKVLDEIHKELRNSIFELAPSALLDGDLRSAVGHLMLLISESNSIETELDYEESIHQLNPQTASHLFRIVQELLHNTIKHAEAKSLYLRLCPRGDDLILEYMDDGRGFNQNETHSDSFKHYGLASINERVTLLSGSSNIISSLGDGFSFSLTIPLG